MARLTFPDGTVIETGETVIPSNLSKSQAAKPATVAKMTRERYDQAAAIVELERQADSWSAVAKDRATDHEVAELYRGKADRARQEAERLTRELRGADPGADLAKSLALDTEAARYERLSKETPDRELSAYYGELAAERHAEAAHLRGETGDAVKAVDLARAAKLEAEARAFERKADGTTASDLVRFYRMRARDLREAAAIARGEKLAYDSQGKHLAGSS
jgi:hypothetical protein